MGCSRHCTVSESGFCDADTREETRQTLRETHAQGQGWCGQSQTEGENQRNPSHQSSTDSTEREGADHNPSGKGQAEGQTYGGVITFRTCSIVCIIGFCQALHVASFVSQWPFSWFLCRTLQAVCVHLTSCIFLWLQYKRPKLPYRQYRLYHSPTKHCMDDSLQTEMINYSWGVRLLCRTQVILRQYWRGTISDESKHYSTVWWYIQAIVQHQHWCQLYTTSIKMQAPDWSVFSPQCWGSPMRPVLRLYRCWKSVHCEKLHTPGLFH